ncbi:MAG: hypothetical protein RLZZ93_1389 [Actinomycetota bacterium]
MGLVCPYSMSVPGGVQDQVLGLARSLEQRGHEALVIAPGLVADPDIRSVSAGRAFRYRVNGSMARAGAARRADGTVDHPAGPRGPSGAGGRHVPRRRRPHAVPHLRRPAASARPTARRPGRRLGQRPRPGSGPHPRNGIDLTPFSGPAPARTSRPTVLFLGRHDPRKGLDVLLRAARGLPDDVTLWVAGDGPGTAELQEQHHGPHVRWLGRISDADKIRRMRSAWAVCAPSLHGESFGIVLLEAMAAGTPLVASDLPGYRRLTEGVAAPRFVSSGGAARSDGGRPLLDRRARRLLRGDLPTCDRGGHALRATTRLRPCCFASYIARSARSMRVSVQSDGSTNVTPMLTVTCSS